MKTSLPVGARSRLSRGLGILALVLVPTLAIAQPLAKPARIGFVSAYAWGTQPSHQGFAAGMRERGYLEGRDYVMLSRAVAPAGLAELAAEFVRLPVDLLYVPICGVPLNAARRATQSIPIVVSTCNDELIETGIVKSMHRPGGNITGLSKLTPELAPRRLSLLKQALPSISRVAVLWNPTASDFTADWRELRAAAQRLDIVLVPFEFRHPDDFKAAFAAIRRERVDALLTFSDTLVYGYAGQVALLAAEARMPAIFAFRELPDAGGLMSYGPNIVGMWQRSADHVVKILNGMNPAEMPIEQPSRFELVINVKAAKALGISVPESLLRQADHVIR